MSGEVGWKIFSQDFADLAASDYHDSRDTRWNNPSPYSILVEARQTEGNFAETFWGLGKTSYPLLRQSFLSLQVED